MKSRSALRLWRIAAVTPLVARCLGVGGMAIHTHRLSCGRAVIADNRRNVAGLGLLCGSCGSCAQHSLVGSCVATLIRCRQCCVQRAIV